MPRRTTEPVDIVVFNGITFRRYPNSKNLSDRKYYRPNSCWIMKGVKHLHREIWKSHHKKEVPKGFHIHHIDKNTLNNSIENLECINGSKHVSRHLMGHKVSALHHAKMVESAKAWHKSDIGRAWHSNQFKKMWRDKKSISDKSPIL